MSGFIMDLNKLIQPEKPNVEPTLTRKAILWGRENLLSEAVSLFLETSTSWNVIRISCNGGADSLSVKIKDVKPDVVILCQEKGDEDSVLLLRLMNERYCPKVITLNLENNLMQVYSKQDVVIQGVKDLLSVIDVDFHSTCVPDKEVKYESFQAKNHSNQ